jgi:hypothetical protein
MRVAKQEVLKKEEIMDLVRPMDTVRPPGHLYGGERSELTLESDISPESN